MIFNLNIEDEVGEIWEDISGYENMFQISNHGRVKSLSRKWFSGRNYVTIKSKILKPNVSKIGYLEIVIKDNGVSKLIRIHRAVAKAFINNSESKPNVNHKNGIKTDNNVDNLEWCTQQENIIHSYKNGLEISNFKGKTDGLNHLAVGIYCITNNKSYECMATAARELKINPSHISSVCKGKRKQTQGYVFKYL